jgi:predicted anti-sigma-YlaC factor YlaD
MIKPRILLFALGCLLALNGCSIRQVAVSKLADTLAKGGSTYASDNDLELVGDALPFSLKTIEGLLLEVPEHRALLLTAASGFTQYSYAWVDLESFVLEDSDPQRAGQLKRRAKNLYLRGRAYALRAVELRQADFVGSLRQDATGTLSRFSEENIPELYWLALSWAAAIATDTTDMDLVADLSLVDAIMRRCLELDESFDDGALHEFMIAWQGGRSPLQGGGADSARQHFERAVALAGDMRIGGLVSLAESVSVSVQNRAEFERLLERALAFNVDAHPSTRLANLVAQRRARVLLNRVDHFFLED